mmetsp:Transcript_6866/g.17762  ORF Transcript_6866/g.17762 Transcript_6866/m.17762 type:complete len:333 (+) Transcript_6866:94-1092(+)
MSCRHRRHRRHQRMERMESSLTIQSWPLAPPRTTHLVPWSIMQAQWVQAHCGATPWMSMRFHEARPEALVFRRNMSAVLLEPPWPPDPDPPAPRSPPKGKPKTEGLPPKTICLLPGTFQHTWSRRGEGSWLLSSLSLSRSRVLLPSRSRLPRFLFSLRRAEAVSSVAAVAAAAAATEAGAGALASLPPSLGASVFSLVHWGSFRPMSMTKDELSRALTGPMFAMPPKAITRVPSTVTSEWPMRAGGFQLVSTFLHASLTGASLLIGFRPSAPAACPCCCWQHSLAYPPHLGGLPRHAVPVPAPVPPLEPKLPFAPAASPPESRAFAPPAAPW